MVFSLECFYEVLFSCVRRFKCSFVVAAVYMLALLWLIMLSWLNFNLLHLLLLLERCLVAPVVMFIVVLQFDRPCIYFCCCSFVLSEENLIHATGPPVIHSWVSSGLFLLQPAAGQTRRDRTLNKNGGWHLDAATGRCGGFAQRIRFVPSCRLGFLHNGRDGLSFLPPVVVFIPEIPAARTGAE